MNEDKEALAAKILGFMKQHDPIEYSYDEIGSKYAHQFSKKLAEHLLQESNTGNWTTTSLQLGGF
nr:hypothetical protein [Providencia rettgeri]